jgi:DNA transformation protein
MFGGHGIYWNGTIFSIKFRDRLSLKVDDQSRGHSLARGMEPFRPNESQTLKSYYKIPSGVLDDGDELLAWAKKAIRAAHP